MSAGQPEPDEGGAALLRRRAALLARPKPAPVAGLVPVLELTVGGQGIAIELPCLCEVRPYRTLAPLPFPARSVLGVASLRGRMLPVLDLAGMLGLGGAQAPRHLVVIGGDRARFAIAGEGLRGLNAVSAAQAARRAASLDSTRSELVAGVTPDGHLLLDSQRLLALRRGE